jgi:inner membrane protein
MDSLTQAMLGATVVGAIAGKKYGRKAVLAGAICGTLPDLDVFIPYGDPISNMVEHRGFSHSLIFLILVSPLVVWLFSKIKWFELNASDKRLHIAILLALITHPLLDAMTIYGTQLLWPITQHPFGVGSVFIIDPIYSAPMLLCLIYFIFNTNARILQFSLLVSSIYLIWSAGAQYHVTNIAKQSLDDGDYTQVISLPTPFNTVLWRVLMMKDNAYAVGYYSFLDKNKKITFNEFKYESDLPISDDVERLKAFTRGYFGVIQVDNNIIQQDLRMGLEPNDYVFQYIVGTGQSGEIKPVPNEKYSVPRDTKTRLNKVWNRIFYEDVVM